MKKHTNLFKALFLMAFLSLLLIPTGAFAASGDIFDIIQAKMLSTAKDVRKIVYVIAGFGLIMFSVLAIFNKISFKHLGYIMISLSLLAMMTPFINYFSGAGLDESDFNRGDFLKEDTFASSDAGNHQSNPAQTPTDPGNDSKPESADPSSPFYNPKLDPNSPQYDPNYTPANFYGGELEGATVTAEGGSLPSLNLPNQVTSNLPDPGLAMPGGGSGAILGAGAETGAESKRTFGEWLNDTVEKGEKFVDNVNAGINAAENAAAAVEIAVAGADRAGQILAGDGTALDKLGGLVNVTTSTASGVGSSLNHALGDAGSVTDYLGWEGASDWLDRQGDIVSSDRDKILGGANTAGNIVGLGNDIKNTANRLGIGNNKDDNSGSSNSSEGVRGNTGSSSGSSSTVPSNRDASINPSPTDMQLRPSLPTDTVVDPFMPNPVIPTLPTDPAVPVSPTLPTNPTLPVNPTIPANPVSPSLPTNPVEPTKPVVTRPVVTRPVITRPTITRPTVTTPSAGSTVSGRVPSGNGGTASSSTGNATRPTFTRPIINRSASL